MNTTDPEGSKAASGVAVSSSADLISWWQGARALINAGSSAPYCHYRTVWLTERATHRVTIRPPGSGPRVCSPAIRELGIYTLPVVLCIYPKFIWSGTSVSTQRTLWHLVYWTASYLYTNYIQRKSLGTSLMWYKNRKSTQNFITPFYVF